MWQHASDVLFLIDALDLIGSADLDTARRFRRGLSAAIDRAISLLDAVDAATEDLEPEPDEDGADAEAVNEDGDPLDAGELDGWRRPRRARVARTEWPVAMAEREGRRAAMIAAVVTSPNVVRFPGGPAHG